MTVNHGWIMARRAVILFLPFLSALLFVSFFCLFLSLLTVESAREKYRGEKKISFSFPILDRTMYTAKTSPKYRRLRPSTRKVGARELSLHGHFAIYPRSRTLFICLLPSTFPLSSFFLSLVSFTESLLFSRSVPNAHSYSRPPYFALILFARASSVRVADFPPLSPVHANFRFCSAFFLAGNTRTIKGIPWQKYCPLPRKRHSNFNASAMPRYPPLALFRQRCCNGPGTRYSRQQSTVISRFLSNLLTYFAFAAVRARFTSIRSSPSSFRPSSTPAVSLPLVQNLL